MQLDRKKSGETPWRNRLSLADHHGVESLPMRRELQHGLSHAQSSVYSYLKDYYSLDQLESMGFWNALNQKATRLGGFCTGASPY